MEVIAKPPQDIQAATIRLAAWWDLPKEDPRSHELSGISWDESRHVLYAIPDKTQQIVELVPDATFQKWRFGSKIPVSIPGEWDGEGLAVAEAGFLLSSEMGPRVYEVTRTGAWQATVPLPDHFQNCRPNLSLESLTLTADQRYMFTANEQALLTDGATATRQAGTLVRILRYDRVTAEKAEFAYRTDPIFLGSGNGELGVVDLAAISSQDLLVMERGYIKGSGNSVRIYRVNTEGSVDVLTSAHLAQDSVALKKTLLLDLSTLPDDVFPASTGPQPSRVMANFEGLALGPRIAGGQRLLFLISDDNSGAAQLARLLVLGVVGL